MYYLIQIMSLVVDFERFRFLYNVLKASYFEYIYAQNVFKWLKRRHQKN